MRPMLDKKPLPPYDFVWRVHDTVFMPLCLPSADSSDGDVGDDGDEDDGGI